MFLFDSDNYVTVQTGFLITLKYNRSMKHLENADTSTSVTFDMWAWSFRLSSIMLPCYVDIYDLRLSLVIANPTPNPISLVGIKTNPNPNP